MLDGSDAVSDWALLNFATGIGQWRCLDEFSSRRRCRYGLAVSMRGRCSSWWMSDEADERLRMCLTNDPALGVIRHADAGYDLARRTAALRDIDMPSIK